MHTGKKIKILRTYKGLTQQDIADKVNKTRALISHIEQSGKVNYYTLMEILRVLEITHDEFEQFDEKKSVPNASYTSSRKYSNHINEIATLKERLINCQKENTILKDLVESQKKVIDILEGRKAKADKK